MLLVQSKSGTTASATSLTIALTNPVTAGNCLVVCVGAEDGTDNPTVSGITIGGTADSFRAAATAYSNSFVNAATWIDPSCAGGQTSVVISLTGGSGGGPGTCAWVMEWSGLQAAPLDKAPAGLNNSGTSWASASTGTLTQPAELVIGCMYNDSGGTVTAPGTPWTELAQLTESGNILAVGYQVVSATTAVTYSGTGSSGDYGACIITLLAASSAPPPVVAVLIPPSPFSPMSSAALPPPPPPAVPAPVADFDSGTGSDTSALAVSGTDTGPGADAGTLTLPGADTGSGADSAAVTADLGGTETGSGADTGSAVLGASGADTGSGADAASAVVAVPSADTGTGTGAESAAITAALSGSDTGSGADAGALHQAASDTGSGTESGSYTVKPVQLWNAPDKLSKAGGTMS
jgi:hypothetical protein